MLAFPAAIRIYVAVQPVDMRKSFNGLWSAVSERLQEDPKSGAVFAFINFDGGRKVMIVVREADMSVETRVHRAVGVPHLGEAGAGQRFQVYTCAARRHGGLALAELHGEQHVGRQRLAGLERQIFDARRNRIQSRDDIAGRGTHDAVSSRSSRR